MKPKPLKSLVIAILLDITENWYAESQLFTLMAFALGKGNDQEPDVY